MWLILYSRFVDLAKIIKDLVAYDKKELLSFYAEFWGNIENLEQSFNVAKDSQNIKWPQG